MIGKASWNQEGGGRELLRVALPLILSSSFMTLQITIDRALLSQASSDTVAAAMPAALFYWTPLILLQNIAGYATTFVAQYTGAGRLQRVGPVVWQSLYFSLTAGVAFLGLLPLAAPLFEFVGHSAAIQVLEVTYFRCLCFAALPTLLVASANSFFSGRGETWVVLLNDAAGLTVNAVLAYCLIFGHLGLPALGIAGAGWATVAGSTTSAALALTLLARRKYRIQFATWNWRFDGALFKRMLRFGFPNGLQWMLEALAFTVFICLVGKLGSVELAATNIAFSINMVGLLPMLGMGQAIGVLVGQGLGRDRPDLAARSTWTGFWLATIYIGTVAILYVTIPEALFYVFRSESDVNTEAVARLVPVLLCYAAVYSLFDSMNIAFSFALRGAGDMRFVTLVSIGLAWPCMVLPTWVVWKLGRDGALYWAWGFASFYISAMGVVFLGRFCTGKWKSMRVIEAAPLADAAAEKHNDAQAVAVADPDLGEEPAR